MPQLQFDTILQTNIKTIPFKIILKTTPFKEILASGLGVNAFPLVPYQFAKDDLQHNKKLEF